MQIKFFKKEKSFKKKEEWWLNFNLYWKFVVLVFFIAVILSTILGYYFYLGINKEIVIEEFEISGEIKIVKKERIDKVLEYFSSKQQKSNQILNSPSPVIDPSL